MISNCFCFTRPCLFTEAIITSIQFDRSIELYELALLGLDEDEKNFTNPGKAWMDQGDIEDLAKSGNLDSVQELVGIRIMFISNAYNGEFDRSGKRRVLWKEEQKNEKKGFNLDESYEEL